MKESSHHKDHLVNDDPVKKVMDELQQLEKEYVDANGIKLRPSQCYRIGKKPFHILYNTNCPDSLKQRIDDIVSRYQPG